MDKGLKKIWEDHKVEIVLLSALGVIFLSGYAAGYKYGVSKWAKHLSIQYFANETGAIDRMIVNGKAYKLVAGAVPVMPLA